jgi:hypothetical protein
MSPMTAGSLPGRQNIPIRSEKQSFQFRWEIYNVFNHTQYSSVDTGARSPTIMQGSLKFQF